MSPLLSAEDCLLEKSYTDCGYSQGKDDDFDWEQINTKQKPSSDPWVPSETCVSVSSRSWYSTLELVS
ncbi:receptor-type tyrosine- phosphatase mu-like protein [Labeo rohita]|uniref:Receptor-type tyrosine-phosphatase mu-like protein n=1 Tax=Labeo rohita TaxID=84645 RepID=A0A498P3K7_LABRO|nr:receptor-type tyrosine- phosphatase mu-like protein [Labeo rohita]